MQTDNTPHRGSIEAHARATIAQMKPDAKWQFLQQMIAEEIKAQHEAVMDDLVKRLRDVCASEENGRMCHSAYRRIEAQAAEIARLREALEFYADTSKYPAPLTGGAGALYFDCGKRALDALGDAQ